MKAKMSENINDYRLLHQLGEGVAGKVHLAVLKERKSYGGPGDLVAIKLYKKEFFAEPKQIHRITAEIKAGTEIIHPNIVRIFDGLDEPPEPFIVMEYIDGVTLESWIKMFHPIPEPWIYTVLNQVIEGLNELHKNGITHRDIKPENIMLTSDFSVKIMDLGVIQSPNKPGISPPGKLLGTIRNSSPNVLKGKEYTEVDDIYSLGTAAYTILHGEQLFAEENNEGALINKICNEEIRYDDTSIGGKDKFYSSLLELTKGMLEKDPESRPKSLHEVKESLTELRNNLATTDIDLKPIHGYIASALTGLEENARDVVAFTSKIVADICKDYNIYAHQPRKATDPIIHADIEPKKVYYLDRKRVLDADLLIIIANHPSFGVGQEIEIGSSFGIPTIMTVKEGIKVSRMVKGGFLNLIDDITFDSPEDLERKLRKSLSDNLKKIRSIKDVKAIKDVSFIGSRLVECRENAGYSQDEAAEKIGISRNMLDAIENYPIRYHNISYYILKKICNVYQMDLKHFLTEKEPIKLVSDDKNIRRLEDVAKKLTWPASDYFDLKDEYLKQLAAKNGSSLITEEDWINRHNLLEKRRLKEKSAQMSFLSKMNEK